MLKLYEMAMEDIDLDIRVEKANNLFQGSLYNSNDPDFIFRVDKIVREENRDYVNIFYSKVPPVGDISRLPKGYRLIDKLKTHFGMVAVNWIRSDRDEEEDLMESIVKKKMSQTKKVKHLKKYFVGRMFAQIFENENLINYYTIIDIERNKEDKFSWKYMFVLNSISESDEFENKKLFDPSEKCVEKIGQILEKYFDVGSNEWTFTTAMNNNITEQTRGNPSNEELEAKITEKYINNYYRFKLTRDAFRIYKINVDNEEVTAFVEMVRIDNKETKNKIPYMEKFESDMQNYFNLKTTWI